jgi:hypothetical protein
MEKQLITILKSGLNRVRTFVSALMTWLITIMIAILLVLVSGVMLLGASISTLETVLRDGTLDD